MQASPYDVRTTLAAALGEHFHWKPVLRSRRGMHGAESPRTFSSSPSFPSRWPQQSGEGSGVFCRVPDRPAEPGDVGGLPELPQSSSRAMQGPSGSPVSILQQLELCPLAQPSQRPAHRVQASSPVFCLRPTHRHTHASTSVFHDGIVRACSANTSGKHSLCWKSW